LIPRANITAWRAHAPWPSKPKKEALGKTSGEPGMTFSLSVIPGLTRNPLFIFIPTVAAHMRREVEESLIFTCEKGISRIVTPAAFLARNDNPSPVLPKNRQSRFRVSLGF